jgi:hypothetical protein
MKSRARIVLAISFALLSTGIIVTCATAGGVKTSSHPLGKLKEFDTRFHETINDAIRSPDATTFASQKCTKSFVDQHIQKVTAGNPAVCNIGTSDAKKLRADVNDWIDKFYPPGPPAYAIPDPLEDCTIDTTWFLMKVDLNVVPGGSTGCGISVNPPD